MTAGNLTVGSWNVTAPSGTFSIRNNTSGSTDSILTLGGLGDLGNGVSGTSGDLLYVANGATFALRGDNPSGSGVLKIVLGQSGNFDAAGTLTISAAISDGGNNYSITKTGNGSLTLSGANTFGGGLTLSAGILNINSATAPGTGVFTINGGTITNTSGAAITLANNNSQTWGGDFTFDGGAGTSNLNLGTGAVTLTANRQITTSGATSILIVGGAISGSGFSLTKAGLGTMTLSGASTYSGGTTLSAGTLNINNASALGTGTFTIPGVGTIDNTSGSSVTLSTNNSQSWNANFTFTGSNNLNLGTGAVTLGGGNRTVTVNGNTLTIGGVIGDGGSNLALTKAGNGTLALSGSNTYGGSTTINGGVLSVGILANGGSNSGIGKSSNTGSNLALNGGTLQYTGGTQSTDRLFQILSGGATIDASGSGAITFSSTGSIIFGNPSNQTRSLTLTGTNTDTNTFRSVLGDNGSGTTSVTKTGSGTWALTGTNSYTGVTTIDAGILNASSLANSGLSSSIGASTNAASNLVFGGGTFQYTGAGAVTTDRLFTIGDANGNSASLNASGGAVGTLSFANGGAIAFGTSGAHTLNLTGINTGINTLSLAVGDGTGATSLTKTGGGTWVLSGFSSYTGGTTLSSGLLQLNTSSALGSTSGALTVNGGVLNLNGQNIGAGNLTGSGGNIWNNGPSTSVTLTLGNGNNGGGNYSGVIADNNGAGSGTVALTKTGTGTITLSGANTYSGATAVNAGSLNAAANSALSSTSGITVNSSGTLLITNSAATNRIGNSVGIALNGGTFARSGSGTVSEGAGAHRNGIIVTGASSVGLGALTLQANSTLDLGTGGVGTFVFSSFTPNGNVLNILDYISSASGLNPTVSGTDGTDDRLIFNSIQAANLADFSFNGISATEILLDNGFYEIVPVTPTPEPGTWIVGALALNALGWLQRRRLRTLLRRAA